MYSLFELPFFQPLFYYASFLIFPFILLICLLFFDAKKKKKKKGRAMLYFLLLVGSLLFVYARFVEPQILIVDEETKDLSSIQLEKPVRIAIFSDTHQGLYKHGVSLERLVRQINAQQPDLVLIPGDFLFEAQASDIDDAVLPFSQIQAPAYAVLGNHDVGRPGPDFTADLTDALELVGVEVIEGDRADIYLGTQHIILVGFTDLWKGPISYDNLAFLRDEDVVIGLAHNPDTAYDLPDNHKIDLMISGHTHGGQLCLPLLCQKVVPTVHPFIGGWYEIGPLSLFLTRGVGMSGLPMRFLQPPRLDILTIY